MELPGVLCYRTRIELLHYTRYFRINTNGLGLGLTFTAP